MPGIPKAEARVERWWINSMLLSGGLLIYGDFYNLPDQNNGEFTVIEVERIDMVNKIAECSDAYIKLGKPMDIKELGIDKGKGKGKDEDKEDKS